jgi:hypothetical protein
MARWLVLVLSVAAIAGVAILMRARRRRRDIPELNRHPERLEQMLDKTDDA